MIVGIHHVAIGVPDFQKGLEFYRDVLGLGEGYRPPFPGPGYWMYSGDQPIVHISDCEAGSATRTNPDGMGHGLDHFALWASGLDDQLAVLERHGIEYDRRIQHGVGMIQVFFHDPNGVVIELGFDPVAEGVEKEAAEAETV